MLKDMSVCIGRVSYTLQGDRRGSLHRDAPAAQVMHHTPLFCQLMHSTNYQVCLTTSNTSNRVSQHHLVNSSVRSGWRNAVPP